MALTPEGTPYVESTDLVANYPAASLSLANRVDLVGVLPFADAAARTAAIPTPTDGQFTYLQDTNTPEFYDGSNFVPVGTAPGLVHINTTTFTAQSTVSINNVFTATYDNYCISFDIQNTLGNQALFLRLRVGGVDDTTASSYVIQFLLGGGGSASALAPATNQGQISVLNLQSVHMTNLYSPFLTAQTNAITHSQSYGTGTSFISNFGFNHNQSTSYDGFTFYSASGNMTGTVRIYGYKNI